MYFSAENHHATLRAVQHAAYFQSSSRGLGEVTRRHRRGCPGKMLTNRFVRPFRPAAISGIRCSYTKPKVRIENVLRGSVNDKTTFVYYFGFAGAFNGPRPLGLWTIRSRRVLWMRTDGGVLRMACDGWDGCTMPVESGAHPRYHADPNKTLDHALADLLLTRGEEKVDDRRFASKIKWGVPDQGLQEHVIGKLEHLGRTESAEIRASACVQLWIYTQNRVDNGLRRQADNSLGAAHCACRVKADGNVACE